MRKTSALLITAILLSLPFCFNITTVRASSSSESGPVYEKISEEQWLKDKEGLDNAAIQQLRQKMGETIKQSEN